MAVHDAAARGFARGAADYEKARPSYPQEVVARLAAELGIAPGRRVLDLAAGTGKFTRLLAATGAEVLAVEPVAPMLAELTAALPDVIAVDGTAEAIPLEAASVDVVTVAQAFHWFDVAPALAEIHRVLRPGGGLALVWNERDESVDWVRQFGDILVRHGGARPYVRSDERVIQDEVAESGWFTPVQSVEFANPTPCGPDHLVARAASTSFVSALPDGPRAACLAEVRELARSHPQLAGRDDFDFPHNTLAFWCHRR